VIDDARYYFDYQSPITTATFRAIGSQLNNTLIQNARLDVAISAVRKGGIDEIENLDGNIMLASFAHAKEPKHFQTGELLQMDSAECGYDEKSGKSFAGEMLGTDSGHKKRMLALPGIHPAKRSCDLSHSAQR